MSIIFSKSHFFSCFRYVFFNEIPACFFVSYDNFLKIIWLVIHYQCFERIECKIFSYCGNNYGIHSPFYHGTKRSQIRIHEPQIPTKISLPNNFLYFYLYGNDFRITNHNIVEIIFQFVLLAFKMRFKWDLWISYSICILDLLVHCPFG